MKTYISCCPAMGRAIELGLIDAEIDEDEEDSNYDVALVRLKNFPNEVLSMEDPDKISDQVIVVNGVVTGIPAIPTAVLDYVEHCPWCGTKQN